jgi:predicted phosphodiesterase
MKLGIVGDLSGRDPARLEKALTAALAACDVVVQVGDLHAGYDLCKRLVASSGGRLYLVPGNHDVNYDSIGFLRNWKVTLGDGLVTLIGIDNSNDVISPGAWSLLDTPGASKYGFVFAHKAPKAIVKADGSVSHHVMGEGQPNADADRLCLRLAALSDAMVCGHFHDWTVMDGPWGTPLILEGRGGAADEIGYTSVTILPEGWSASKVTLP